MSVETVHSAELLRQLGQRLRNATLGIRDHEAMHNACEHMDRVREELRQRIGIVEVAVDLIREAREE